MKKILYSFLFVILTTSCFAQGIQQCYTTNGTNCIKVSPTTPLPVTTSSPSGTQSVTGTGTAGTAATGVVTVQGIADMTPVTTQLAGQSFTNITTNTDTNVKASAGTFVGIVVNTGGTTSTAAVYNDADGTCSSGLIGTFDTTAPVSLTVNANATVGICVTTAGAGAADITILWR